MTYPVIQIDGSTTQQQVFDAVVKHLRKQGVESQLGLSCRYRVGPDLACAVGCLLTDAEAKAGDKDEDTKFSAEFVARHCLERLSPFLPLLRELQLVHDRTLPSAWEDDLKRVAEQFQLTYTPAEERWPQPPR